MKKLIKSLLFFLGYLFHYNHKSKIIYYHDIGKKYTTMGTPLELFKKHIECIRKSGFSIVPTITADKGQIQICFDDGWKGLYEVRDYFIEQDIRPTIFLAVNLVGDNDYLNWDEIHSLQELGFIFESHTVSHKELTLFDTNDLKYELTESKKILEEKLHKTIKAICFPCGCYSDEVVNESYLVGYDTLYSSVPGPCGKNNKGLLKRNLVQDATEQELNWVIKGDSVVMRKKTRKLHYSK